MGQNALTFLGTFTLMYELEYVKKRKRRRRVAIIGGISTVVVSTLCIVAFLGRYVGTFTVSLDTGNVKLALSLKSTFETSTSFLRVDNMPLFREYTYGSFEELGHDVIDNEETTTNDLAGNYDGGFLTSVNFFKYTFYVKNVGDSPARYTFQMNILDLHEATDGSHRTLEDSLRVMIYDNADLSKHDKTVYGKKSAIPHDDGQGGKDYRAPVTVDDPDDPEFYGYAEMFNSSSVVTTLSVPKIVSGEIRRYTIVMWLEGFRSSYVEEAPEGATMKLGVEINGYGI